MFIRLHLPGFNITAYCTIIAQPEKNSRKLYCRSVPPDAHGGDALFRHRLNVVRLCYGYIRVSQYFLNCQIIDLNIVKVRGQRSSKTLPSMPLNSSFFECRKDLPRE